MKARIGQFDVSFKNNWNRPIHGWYRFHAGCSSQFPERMIELLQIRKRHTIMDPFVGSGTILVCAKERGINSIGFDVNPFYVLIASVKTYWEFNMNRLFEVINSFISEIKFSLETKTVSSKGEKSRRSVDNIPTYIWRYFDTEVLSELSFLKTKVAEIESKRIRDFLLLALASILIDVSKVHYVGETIVFNNPPRRNEVPVHELYIQKILEMFSDLKTKQQIREKGNVKVRRCDVRNLNSLIPDGGIDHVITHPPYLNNYNYLLHDRLPLYFLEYFKKPSDEEKMRGLIIGSVTKNKAFMESVSYVPEAKKIAERVKNTGDIERYKAILEYFDSMNLFLKNLHDKLKRNGYCAMLVGNSYIRGVMIPLDATIAKMAEKIGFKVVETSVVRDRGNGAFQHLYNGKLYESVVLLKRI